MKGRKGMSSIWWKRVREGGCGGWVAGTGSFCDSPQPGSRQCGAPGISRLGRRGASCPWREEGEAALPRGGWEGLGLGGTREVSWSLGRVPVLSRTGSGIS